MPTLVCEKVSELEELLYLSAVDHTFRTNLLDDPGAFGLERENVSLPDAVERQDQESLNVWIQGLEAVEVYNCTSTCSYGPVTILCDGSTK
jgi:hypothetical protein